MKKIVCTFLLLVSGCSSVSKNPKDYSWYAEYRNGDKLIAYVEWFDDNSGCIGSALYVPEVKNVQEVPLKIIREKNGVTKEFHMCSEDANPNYLAIPRFNEVK